MGGAADQSQRSSSPLKRRASDFDAVSSQDDVDMLAAPSSDPTVPVDTTPQLVPTPRSKRAQSIDMLQDEPEVKTVETINGDSQPAANSVTTGTGILLNFQTLTNLTTRLRCTSYRRSDQDSHGIIRSGPSAATKSW
jgi:hypothetical protein